MGHVYTLSDFPWRDGSRWLSKARLLFVHLRSVDPVLADQHTPLRTLSPSLLVSSIPLPLSQTCPWPFSEGGPSQAPSYALFYTFHFLRLYNKLSLFLTFLTLHSITFVYLSYALLLMTVFFLHSFDTLLLSM